MGYYATCDGTSENCQGAVESPLLLGQFNPDAVRTTQIGGVLSRMGYDEGDTITLCPECTLDPLNHE